MTEQHKENSLEDNQSIVVNHNPKRKFLLELLRINDHQLRIVRVCGKTIYKKDAFLPC